MTKHQAFTGHFLKFVIATLIILLMTPAAFAYNFYDVRSKLASDLSKTQIPTNGKRLTVVYNIEDKDDVKKNHNLVDLKKELSYELLKSFEVVDPIIVHEILSLNNLTYQDLLTKPSLLKQFSERSECDQILFVDLSPRKSGNLTARFKLLNTNADQITGLEKQFAATQVSKPAYETASVMNQVSTDDNSVLQSFISDFVPKSFVSGQNDAWMYFQPTALIIPENFAVETHVWLRDLAEVDIRATQIHFDAKLVEMFQVGAQLYMTSPAQSASQGIHSLYVSGKYQLSEQLDLPLSVAIGIRKRLLFNADNTDFTLGDAGTNETNDRHNATTFQAMATGKLENIGLMYNLYLDNMVLTGGAKFLLTSEIKLFVDEILYYYPNPAIPSDTTFGVQLYNVAGYASLAYQLSAGQLLLGFCFDF